MGTQVRVMNPFEPEKNPDGVNTHHCLTARDDDPGTATRVIKVGNDKDGGTEVGQSTRELDDASPRKLYQISDAMAIKSKEDVSGLQTD